MTASNVWWASKSVSTAWHTSSLPDGSLTWINSSLVAPNGARSYPDNSIVSYSRVIGRRLLHSMSNLGGRAKQANDEQARIKREEGRCRFFIRSGVIGNRSYSFSRTHSMYLVSPLRIRVA